MQYKLSHLPLLKIVLPLIAGILFFNYTNISFPVLLITTGVLFMVFLVSHFSIETQFLKKLNAVIGVVFVFIIGGLMISNKKFSHQQNHFSLYNATFAKGIISKPLEEKEKTYKTFIAVQHIIDSTEIEKTANGNLLVYIQKDSTLANLEVGDVVLLQLKIQSVASPKNIGEFDYKNFLQHKSVFQQQYITKNEITVLQKHKSLWVKRFSNSISLYVQTVLKKYIPKQENFALADGILLGHRADIDVELYNAFAYTGILHILSVSGLHVGIIYGMLVFLLSFIKDKNKKIKIAKFVFILGFIWLFTFVTGFSAACVRAAILFSLLNYGSLNKEYVNNLNVLCGAALLQILIDPNNVFDIGFQLSYLAMLGLFIFYKPIYALYYSSNWLLDKIWSLWSASIAAQLFTVPLSIYYFGNFPTYFLLANIFAIPLSAVILWLSVALIPFSFIPFLATIIGWLNSLVISLFIKLTWFFSNLPLGKLFNLYITKWQLIILFIAILCLTFFVIKRNAKFAIACLSLFLVTIFISYAYNIQQVKKQELVFYSVQKNFVLAINNNGKQSIFTKDTLTEKAFSFSIKNSHRILGINEYQTFLLNDSLKTDGVLADKDLLIVQNKSFYFLKKDNTRKTFATPLQIDYLVLSDNCFLNIESVKANYVYKQLLISSDNDNYHLKIFRKLLNENDMKYVDMSENSLVVEL
jgi:competence protein ComEC